MVKNLPANVEDVGSIPGSGRSLGEGNGNPLQYSCLGNPMDRGALWAIVHRVTKSQTQFRDKTTNHQPPSRPCADVLTGFFLILGNRDSKV